MEIIRSTKSSQQWYTLVPSSTSSTVFCNNGLSSATRIHSSASTIAVEASWSCIFCSNWGWLGNQFIYIYISMQHYATRIWRSQLFFATKTPASAGRRVSEQGLGTLTWQRFGTPLAHPNNGCFWPIDRMEIHGNTMIYDILWSLHGNNLK